MPSRADGGVCSATGEPPSPQRHRAARPARPPPVLCDGSQARNPPTPTTSAEEAPAGSAPGWRAIGELRHEAPRTQRDFDGIGAALLPVVFPEPFAQPPRFHSHNRVRFAGSNDSFLLNTSNPRTNSFSLSVAPAERLVYDKL